MKIKTIIADDLVMFLNGLELLLQTDEGIEVVGKAKNGKELVDMVVQKKPDVVVVDIQMPVMDGIEATKRIIDISPLTSIIALTMYEEEHLIVDMLEAGAIGYVLKSNTHDELIQAVHTTHQKTPYYCNATSLRSLKLIANSKSKHSFKSVEFTEKEKEIIRLICEQHASKEIASKTNLTYRTVEKYRNKIMEKIEAKNVVGVVIYAIRNGLFKL